MRTSATTRRPRLRRFIRWTAVIAILLLVATVASVEVTSRSSFCDSCHIMGSYYASWESGTHSDVPCVECHIAPGPDNYVRAKLNGLGQVVDDWLNRTSTKPSASVSDFACTRPGCHDLDDVLTAEATDVPYLFRHDKHLNLHSAGIVVHCTTCHSHVQGSTHFEVNTNVCVTCHLYRSARETALDGPLAMVGAHPDAALAPAKPAGAEAAPPSRCDACHIPPQERFEYHGLTVDHAEYIGYGAACDSCHRGVTATPQPITDAECLSCHDFGMERAGDVKGLHRTHAEGSHKVECFSCHGVIRHGPDAATMSLALFDCRTCHADQHMVQRQTYDNHDAALSTPSAPVSPMFLVHVDCNGCHVEPVPLTVNPTSGASVRVAVPAACDRCHRPGMGEMMVPLWQRTTRRLHAEVTALMPSARNPWAGDDPATRSAVAEAERLLDLVRLDGSWGVHNPRYTEELLERARARLLEASAGKAGDSGGSP